MTQTDLFTLVNCVKKEPGKSPVKDLNSVLDCVGVALVDTCTAVDAFGLVDDCDIVYGDCTLGACVCARSACDTVVSNDFCHISNKFELGI